MSILHSQGPLEIIDVFAQLDTEEELSIVLPIPYFLSFCPLDFTCMHQR
jgi:hypothetical protein